MEDILSQITWWHWLALGLLLFGIEMMTGTFDLLMVALAAWLTGLFAALAPESMAGWQGQFIVFAAAAALLVTVGRIAFSGRRRKVASDRPGLNDRMASLVGQRGEVTREFAGGHGQVRIGDTVWGAEMAEGEPALAVGDPIVVASTRANMAIVRKA